MSTLKLKKEPALRPGELVKKTLGVDRGETEERSHEEASVAPDAREPQELEDTGDSLAHVEDDPPRTHGREEAASEPVVWRLPRRLRPQVRFRIDAKLCVHPLAPSRDPDGLELGVAEAIAAHLRNCNLPLTKLGDWTAIPCVGTLPDLVALAPEAHRAVLAERLHSASETINDFAIELPSADVVRPMALISSGGEGKTSTRAAALRCFGREQMPNGELWEPKDWQNLTANENKARKRAEKASRASAEGEAHK